MKLNVYIQYYNSTPDTDFVSLWWQSMIWAITEHGLSLFAASVLAIRPFFVFVSQSVGSLSSKLGYGSGSRKSVSGRGTSSRVSKVSATPGSTELGRIGVRNDFDVRSEYDVEEGSRNPEYKVDAYGDDESSRTLTRGASKSMPDVETDEVVH